MSKPPPELVFRALGQVDYVPTLEAMRAFTRTRDENTPDEIWLLQHPPVFTQGLAGKPEHLIASTDIPVVKIDRGGQITYHGPGQLVAYLLLDLNRRPYKVRELVERMEQAVINTLASYGIQAERLKGAPGVYVDGAKIAALGLRVQKSCTYHGLALNVDMDLSPYRCINPCGYAGMNVIQLRDLAPAVKMATVQAQLQAQLLHTLNEHHHDDA